MGRISSRPAFAGLLVVGSFARGEADGLSDLDVIALAAPGRVGEAWAERGELHPADAVAWDVAPAPKREAAKHMWLTPDLVLADCLIAAPEAVRVAVPFAVLLGDDGLEEMLVRRPPITAAEMDARRGELPVHELEQRYHDLKIAVRAARASGQATP
jgi:hypothetical protein